MAKTTRAGSAPAHTIEWFEREVLERTPKVGILAGADQGLWSLVENSGALAGIWKKHRIAMQELDAAAVSASLGAVLAAVVQTANAVGLPLNTLMEQQIALMPMPPHGRVKQRKEPHAVIPPPPLVVSPRRTRAAAVIPDATAGAAVPVLPPRRSRIQKAVSVSEHPMPTRGDVVASPTLTPPRPKRGRPPKLPLGAMVSPPVPPVQQRSAIDYQPTLLGDELAPVKHGLKRLARTGAR